ncbi:single-stranded DNA-binding protein [Inquilinus sp. NPDC058860]|uniref:single-stranded DNA-binding protein n=1 Tax=Inquilinus sp. NPDC058860 TaxID=3346652 RepID=UPI0036933564
MNKFIVSGHLGDDVEIFTFQDGRRKASLSLASNEGYKDRETGAWVDRTAWHKVITYQKGLISMLEKHGTKGRLAQVVGTMTYRKYRIEGEGSDRVAPEVLVDERGEIEFPTPPKRDGDESGAYDR